MTKPQIPNERDVIGPAIDKLVEKRPNAAKHLKTGRYGHIVAGWKGQFAVARRRLTEEVIASRTKTASGGALREIAAGQYDTEWFGEARALGDWTITRAGVHYRKDTQTLPSSGTTSSTVFALLEAQYLALEAHYANVFSASTGLGAHVAAATNNLVDPNGTSSMTDWVTAANTNKSRFNEHLADATAHPHG